MTDWLDKKAWPERLEADERFRDAHLYAFEAMLSGAAGPHYSERIKGQYMPENHYHAYTSLTVPRLAHEVPAWWCRTRRPGSQRQTAEAIRHGLNRWAKDTLLRDLAQQFAYDYCFLWCVAMVRQLPNRWMGKTTEQWVYTEDGSITVKQDASLLPAAYRIPPQQFILDSTALKFDLRAYCGHQWYAHPDKIKAEAERHPGRGWDMKAIADLATAADDGGSAAQSDPFRKGRVGAAPKPELEFITIWVADLELPESKGPKEGYHGTILTFARAQGKGLRGRWRFVKEPKPYWGPESGPYHLWGAYQLPNALYPQSPLVAVEGQIRELNRHARAVSRSAEKHKNLVLYDERDTRTAAKIRRARNDFFVGIPGFDRTKFAEAQIGGVTDTQYKQTAYLLDRLQRIAAMDESQQGNVTGIGTATEHGIANEVSGIRIGHIQQRFRDGVNKGCGQSAAWFLYKDGEVKFPLGEEAALELDMTEPWFHGGMDDGDASFADLELEIELRSMQPPDNDRTALKIQGALNWVLQTGPMRSQMPYVDWPRIDDLAAQVFEAPELLGLVDNEAALAAQPFVDGGVMQPRLSQDVGNAPPWGGQGGGGFGGIPPRQVASSSPMAQAQQVPGRQGSAGLLGIGQGAPV